MDYESFFANATGRSPFPYQLRFRLEPSTHLILKAGTGLGKTDAVLIDWLHRRAVEPITTTRRLVWCLPGRALSEQVFSIAQKRVAAAALNEKIRVCRLLGGSADNDLTLSPDECAILVGTQDLLLSRALNRGYARSPFRWPIDFALLNNDCSWVLDEVQLLGDGLATSTQLAAFRQIFGCFGRIRNCWISATFDPAWLNTVDFLDSGADIRVVEPNEHDREHRVVQQRLRANKVLTRAPVECRTPAGAAAFCSSNHCAGTLSLIVSNTVARAREIADALARRTAAEVLLLHSRFRSPDRAANLARLTAPLPPEGRIAVATQVVEAGIDISARLLLTDIAPYPALVQRFGRVNRYGEQTDAQIYWVDRPLTANRKGWLEAEHLKPKEEEQVSRPYSASDISSAITTLEPLHSAAPDDLPPVDAPPPWQHVLRRADLLDLFDTSPDLAGNEIDISRFVRSDNDRDVYVAWRNWDGGPEAAPIGLAQISEEEVCPVPIAEIREFAKHRAVWRWHPLDGSWQRAELISPGVTLMAHASVGGYTAAHGWSPNSSSPVEPLLYRDAEEPERVNDDRLSWSNSRQSLAEHTDAVCASMENLLRCLEGLNLEQYRSALISAAREHDWGKAHPVMQETLHNGPGPYVEILAKQAKSLSAKGHSVPFFRHELASALAMLGAGEDYLAAYVAAAHHGRVRVSIRSMPGERDSGAVVARGVRDGDELLAADLGGGVSRAATRVTLKPMALGLTDLGESWTDRVLRLRDELGPFRLVYLEMLLRAADVLGSQNGTGEMRQ
jgi:CRISPR-associated endonuclease/helicase Cas3